MNKNIKDVLVLNGPILIRVVDDKVIISAYQSEVKMPYNPIDTPPDISGVLVHRKGNVSLEVTSDVFDVLELPFDTNDFEDVTLKEIFKDLVLASIQFIAKVSVEEDRAVLIQNSYNTKSKYFLSTIGLIDDTRIIFAEIKEVSHIKKGKEKQDA